MHLLSAREPAYRGAAHRLSLRKASRPRRLRILAGWRCPSGGAARESDSQRADRSALVVLGIWAPFSVRLSPAVYRLASISGGSARSRRRWTAPARRRDRIPILGWLGLRREARCTRPVSGFGRWWSAGRGAGSGRVGWWEVDQQARPALGRPRPPSARDLRAARAAACFDADRLVDRRGRS